MKIDSVLRQIDIWYVLQIHGDVVYILHISSDIGILFFCSRINYDEPYIQAIWLQRQNYGCVGSTCPSEPPMRSSKLKCTYRRSNHYFVHTQAQQHPGYSGFYLTAQALRQMLQGTLCHNQSNWREMKAG